MQAAEASGVRRFQNVQDDGGDKLPVVLDDGKVLVRKRLKRRSVAEENLLHDLSGHDKVVEPVKRRRRPQVDQPTQQTDQRLVLDRIGSVAAGILANPEQKVRGLDEIHRIAADAGGKRYTLVTRKLALLTEMQVLIDIWPGYRIQPDAVDDQLGEKLSKDVISQKKYETALLAAYNRLLDLLIHLTRHQKSGREEPANLAECALMAIQKIQTEIPQATEGDKLLRLLLTFIEDSKRPSMRKAAVEAAKQVFTSLSQLSSEGLSNAVMCTKALTGIIRKRKGLVRAEVLEPLTYLDLSLLQSRLAVLEKGNKQRSGPRGRKSKLDKDSASKERDLNKAVKEGIATVTSEEARKAFVAMTESLCSAYLAVLMKFADDTSLIKASNRNTALVWLLKGLVSLTPFLRPDVVDSILSTLPNVLVSEGVRPRLRLESLACVYQILRAHNEIGALGIQDDTVTVPSSSSFDLLLAEALQAVVVDLDVVNDKCLLAAARAVFSCVDRRALPSDVIVELQTALIRLACIATSHRLAVLLVRLATDSVMVHSLAASNTVDDVDDGDTRHNWASLLLHNHFHPFIRQLLSAPIEKGKTGLLPEDRTLLSGPMQDGQDDACDDHHSTTFEPPVASSFVGKKTVRQGREGRKKRRK